MSSQAFTLTIDYAPKGVVEVGQYVTIYGRLYRTSAGIPVPNAKVELIINENKKGETSTGLDGKYSFKVKFSKPGTYTVYTVAYIKETGGGGGESGGSGGGGGGKGGGEEGKGVTKINIGTIAGIIGAAAVIAGAVIYAGKSAKRGEKK